MSFGIEFDVTQTNIQISPIPTLIKKLRKTFF